MITARLPELQQRVSYDPGPGGDETAPPPARGAPAGASLAAAFAVSRGHPRCRTVLFPVLAYGADHPHNIWTFFMVHNSDIIMKAPRSVPATEFKAHCLALLEQVRETRQPLLVTRHGKPVVEISAYVPKDAGRINPLKGSILFQDDLISPLEEKWDSAP